MRWQDIAIIVGVVSALLLAVLGMGIGSAPDSCTPGSPRSQLCKQSSVPRP